MRTCGRRFFAFDFIINAMLNPVAPLFLPNANLTGRANSVALRAWLAETFAIAGLFTLIHGILARWARERLTLRHTPFPANAVRTVLH
jgi:hypothetical protein